MPGTKYSPKQKKLAAVAAPKDKINKADFDKLRKSSNKKNTMMSKSYK